MSVAGRGPRYDLIALDLDGTLVAPGQRVSPAAGDAVARAAAAGLRVVPCTGRAWRESVAVLDPLPALGPGVFSSGAVVADFRRGEVLDTAAFEPGLAAAVVDELRGLPFAVLVFQDAAAAGRDFLVAGDAPLNPGSEAWFERNALAVTRIERPTAADLAHTLRVGVVAPGPAARAAEAAVRARCGDRVNAHCLAGLAITLGENAAGEPEPAYLLEVFRADVNKWRGLRWLAGHLGVDPARIAAVGDEVNDLAMLRHAALGVAMGQASDAVKAAADRTTRRCVDDGVAFAIDRILDGSW